MSSEPDTPTEPLDRVLDKNCPTLYREGLAEDNARWLAQADDDLDAVVRVERVRRQNPRVTLAVHSAVNDPEYRAILLGVVEAGGATYDDIEAFVTTSRRTMRRRVGALQEDGVLEVDATAHPVVVTFATEAVALLAEDAFSLFFSTTNTTK